ncbi:MAG: SMI1/KNR4 family protein [Deltaproteobacteria bacterium]|nr:SMI1/KNR4 family protein [Deltaproteobacteria bacterium]
MTQALLAKLPRSYLDLMERWGPGEGFIGTRYFRLYPLDEIAAANDAYGTDSWLAGHLIFGSDGCGDAYLFDLRSEPAHVIEAPFIPLDTDYVSARHPDFESFLAGLAALREGATESLPLAANPKTHGLEVHEIHPIVLGGDPCAPDNKVLLKPPVHAEACMFFNRVFRTVREKSRQETR